MEYLLLQVLNGVQLGLLMFLLAAGLTLTLGIMDLVNLAHGDVSKYLMVFGAYAAALLCQTLPGELRHGYAFFTNSGTQSVECAIKVSMEGVT